MVEKTVFATRSRDVSGPSREVGVVLHSSEIGTELQRLEREEAARISRQRAEELARIRRLQQFD